MKKILLFAMFTTGVFISKAQTLTPSGIWYDVIPAKMNTDSLLTKKGFTLKYGGPKKQGGTLYCYVNKKADEWLFIHTDKGEITSQVSYLLPSLKKYRKNLISKKLLLPGEEVIGMGKTFQENKIYYHLIYTFQKPEMPAGNE